MHFGASRDSATIHDGVLYTWNPDGNELRAQSFATISNCPRHDPVAIWTYLKPVISWALDEHPEIKRIHFQSDGPATQYKCKQNFYLFSTVLYDDFPQLQPSGSSWLFSAAGHGKNAADGIGAAVKHTADRMVAMDTDIPDAHTLFEKLNGKLKVKLFFTPARDVEASVSPPTDLKTVDGAMKIHQLTLIDRGKIQHRQLGCFCNFPETCECFDAVTYCFMGRNYLSTNQSRW